MLELVTTCHEFDRVESLGFDAKVLDDWHDFLSGTTSTSDTDRTDSRKLSCTCQQPMQIQTGASATHRDTYDSLPPLIPRKSFDSDSPISGPSKCVKFLPEVYGRTHQSDGQESTNLCKEQQTMSFNAGMVLDWKRELELAVMTLDAFCIVDRGHLRSDD